MMTSYRIERAKSEEEEEEEDDDDVEVVVVTIDGVRTALSLYSPPFLPPP